MTKGGVFVWENKILSILTTEELKEFRTILTTDKIGKDQLLEQINERINSRQEKSKIITQAFRSDRLPYYDIEKKQVVEEAMKHLNITPFLSLLTNSLTPGNNKVQGLSVNRFYRTGKLQDMEYFFSQEESRENYEGLYNTFQYIKNYIYYCAKGKDEICEEDIFQEEQRKKGIVTADLLNIATYLEEIKEGTKLRLSVGDASLTVSTKEKTTPLTNKQEMLVEALAFGMPLEKLQKGNYEDAKRLLFLPSQIKTNQVK